MLRRFFSFFFFCLLFFFPGCCLVPGVHDHHYSMVGFSPAQENLLEQAAADWNSRTDECHKIYLHHEKTTNKIVLHPDPGLKRSPPSPGGIDGLYKGTEGNIYLRAGITEENQGYYRFLFVAKHEMGHALGLQHTADKTTTPGVMHAPGGFDSSITEEDMAECRSVGACD